MPKLRTILTTGLGFCTLASVSMAQEGSRSDGWQLGLISAVATNPYVGEDTEVVPYPLITYRKGPLSIGTLGIEYEAYDANDLTFSVGVLPRFSGLFSTDAPELDGINRNVTGDLALTFDYDLGRGFHTGLVLRQEVTGEHDGQELILDAGYGIQFGKLSLELGGGVALQSGDLSQYIWGVSSSEARPDRPAYAPGDVIIPFVEINAFRPINDRWTLVGGVRADFLPSEISDSPIVNGDDIFSARLGISLSF